MDVVWEVTAPQRVRQRSPLGIKLDQIVIGNNRAVFAINPKQMDRFCDRHTVAGAKDHALNAFVITDSLRTDQTCFHRFQIGKLAILRLLEWSRMDQDCKPKATG